MDNDNILWDIFHSSWIIFSFIIFLNWAGIAWIGFRVNERKWQIEGGIYFIIAALFFIIVGSGILPALDVVLVLIYFVSWIVSIVRSFIIRKEYLDKLRYMESGTQNYNSNQQQYYNQNQYNQQQYNNNPQFNQQQYDNQNQYNQQNTFNENENHINFNQQNENHIDFNQNNNEYTEEENKITFNNNNKPSNDNTNNNNTLEFNQNNNINTNTNSNDNVNDTYIPVIDINTASADEIVKLPGINLILAKKLVQERSAGNYINSLEDLQERLSLNSNQIDHIRDYVKITPVQSHSRRIDY